MDEELIAIVPLHVESFGSFERILDPFHVDLEGLLELKKRRLLGQQCSVHPLLLAKTAI